MSQSRRQSRRLSLLEAVVNVIVGYAFAVLAQLLFFPAIGLSVALLDHLRLGAIFTGLPVGRSYLLRWVFARLESESGP